MKNITDLTDGEIRQIVGDIFGAKKISCIRRRKRDDEVTCKIYTEWSDGEGEEPFVIADELTLRNPFLYGKKAICVDFPLDGRDYRLLKRFCYAKGIREGYGDIEKDNPYFQKTEMVGKQDVLSLVDEISRLYDSGECDDWHAALRKAVTGLDNGLTREGVKTKS